MVGDMARDPVRGVRSRTPTTCTGGAYGNVGIKPDHTTAQYGNEWGLFITDLLGGGGGGGDYRAAGSGGGAIELIAHGTGVLKLNRFEDYG